MRRVKRDPTAYLPLTPALFHVLVALADGDKHGYAILKEVKRRTDGRVSLGPGTLYAVIKRLLHEELIAESDERPDVSLDDERRRYYRLEPFGRAVLGAEAARMAESIAMVRAKNIPVRS